MGHIIYRMQAENDKGDVERSLNTPGRYGCLAANFTV